MTVVNAHSGSAQNSVLDQARSGAPDDVRAALTSRQRINGWSFCLRHPVLGMLLGGGGHRPVEWTASEHVAGQNQWYHFGVGAPPILEPILVVGLGCSLYDLDFDPWPCWLGGLQHQADHSWMEHVG